VINPTKQPTEESPDNLLAQADQLDTALEKATSLLNDLVGVGGEALRHPPDQAGLVGDLCCRLDNAVAHARYILHQVEQVTALIGGS